VVVIHGYTASSQANWFPHFKDELKSDNIDVIIPDMPDSCKPQCNEWLKHIESSIGEPDENTILIGHSLGCVTLLNYLNEKRTESVKAVFLISGFTENTPISELAEFVKPVIDYNYIKSITSDIVAISAVDDDIVPYEYSKEMAERLDAPFILLDGGKHFIDRDGFTEFTLLVNKVKALIF
jgi:predicted alpha/beta hydrolase family esterase